MILLGRRMVSSWMDQSLVVGGSVFLELFKPDLLLGLEPFWALPWEDA